MLYISTLPPLPFKVSACQHFGLDPPTPSKASAAPAFLLSPPKRTVVILDHSLNPISFGGEIKNSV